MSNILYMAVSRDGFIATPDDETPWSDEEWQVFAAFVRSCDAVLLGRRTYEIMRESGELIEGPVYIVATSQKDFDADGIDTLEIATADDMPKASKLGIIGGGELNGRLAQLGVIDEMYLDIEPVELHEGIKLFGAYEPKLKMELVGSRMIGQGTIQRHFNILS